MSNHATFDEAAVETGAIKTIPPAEARKVAAGALVGNVLEWYDYFLFNTAAALVFNYQFFVTEDAALSAMASFLTLAVGFVVRPIGGLFFGWLGDRAGRKTVLMITVVGIGVATGIIGVLPNHTTIGLWAPLALVVLRMLQGFFIGGEWSGAMTLAVEHAPLNMRSKMAALPQLGSPIGTLLSSGAFYFLALGLSKDSFDSWGWRLPFLAAIPLLLLALWLRAKLGESPVFKELQSQKEGKPTPLKVLFVGYWRQLLVGVGVGMLGAAGFYIATSFIMNYGTRVLGMDKDLLLLGTMIAAAVEIPILLHAGSLGQKFGPSKVLIGGSIFSIVTTIPVFLMITSTQPVLVVLGIVLAIAALSYPFGATGAALTNLFPASNRISGVANSYNGTNIIAGFVPFIATWLVTITNDSWWPAAILLMLFAATTAVCGALAPRLSQQIGDGEYKH